MQEKNRPADTAEEKNEKTGSGKKKIIIISSIIAAAVIIAAAAVMITVFSNQNTDDIQDVDPDDLVDIEVRNYYSGIVEPQQTSNINKDPERKVSEVYVNVGDEVKKGDKLFSYDTEDTANKLAKAQIEYTSYQNEVSDCNNKIAQLTEERSKADESQQLEYTEQIQDQQNTKEQAELNMKMKQVEIDNLKSSLDNSVVTSDIDGTVKSINDSADGSSSAYITILMTGSFRIKCTVDEMNVRDLSEGMGAVVHSRSVEGKTWNGTISKVDTSTTADGSDPNESMGNDPGQNEAASQYTFYVSLSSSDGMLLGEHVYVEPVVKEDSGADADEEAETVSDTAAQTDAA